MQTNFSLLFYLKKPKNYKTGPYVVYIRITYAGVPKELTIGRKWDPERWNDQTGRCSGQKEDARALNVYLDEWQNRIYNAHSILLKEEKIEITAAAIKEMVTGSSKEFHSILVEIEDHNTKMEALVGKDFSQGTLDRYKVLKKHVTAFLSFKYKLKDISVKRIGITFLNDFDFYLRTQKDCGHNYTVKTLKNLGKILGICTTNGWLQTNPFGAYKCTYKKVERCFLTMEELENLIKTDFFCEKLNQVRDVFVFCCYTGLAYADVKKLSPYHIGIGIDGERWIFTNRKKTDLRCAIPLLPVAIKILDRYAEHQGCNSKGVVLPVVSNQNMNDYLKEIAAICCIFKKLSSHIARHTFATTITLLHGVPIETLSQMLGHTTIRATQVYAKIIDLKVSHDMAALKNKLKETAKALQVAVA